MKLSNLRVAIWLLETAESKHNVVITDDTGIETTWMTQGIVGNYVKTAVVILKNYEGIRSIPFMEAVELRIQDRISRTQ